MVEQKYPDLTNIAFRFGIFQRINYLLHIPISDMCKDNISYQSIITYLRKNWWRGMRNKILTTKNKTYQTLFAIMPKGCRILHKRIKGL